MCLLTYTAISGDFKKVPQSGEKNTSFGVYRSDCCGFEIVISIGTAFPDCPKHTDLTTEWTTVIESDGVINLDNISRKKKPESAA
jgi:hypothetical protein